MRQKDTITISLLIGLLFIFMLIILKLPIQLQATLLSAFTAWFLTALRNQTDLAFALHREFNTKEMFEARNKADDFLASQISDIPLDQLYKKPFLEEIQNVLLIIRFYERLWLAIDQSQLNKKLVPKLFGEVFYWWLICCFDKQLLSSKCKWYEMEAAKNIRDLRDWMDKNTEKLERDKWIAWAEEDKKRPRTIILMD